MKKFLNLTALSMVLAVAACSSSPMNSSPDISLKKPAKEQLISEAATKCETLGFERGTKEFRDCTVTQFNKMQDKYY